LNPPQPPQLPKPRHGPGKARRTIKPATQQGRQAPGQSLRIELSHHGMEYCLFAQRERGRRQGVATLQKNAVALTKSDELGLF
jgi:hypothetical protein